MTRSPWRRREQRRDRTEQLEQVHREIASPSRRTASCSPARRTIVSVDFARDADLGALVMRAERRSRGAASLVARLAGALEPARRQCGVAGSKTRDVFGRIRAGDRAGARGCRARLETIARSADEEHRTRPRPSLPRAAGAGSGQRSQRSCSQSWIRRRPRRRSARCPAQCRLASATREPSRRARRGDLAR